MYIVKICLILVLAFTATTSAVLAKQTKGNQTRASGPEIYRIELRNVGEFRVNWTGDFDESGELHEVSIELIEVENTRDRQYDTVIETAPFLRNTSTNEPSGSGYLTINNSDRIRLGQRTGAGTEDAYNLWIHSAYRRPAEGESMTFLINVKSRELDCAGQNVCNRYNMGQVTYEIKMPPLRSEPSRNCTNENTFQLTTVDGVAAVISNSNLTREVAVTTTRRNYSGDTLLRDAQGPFLHLQNAEICIARTW